eukprot:scaffold8374_cov175-Amphora_coffeaeformis.AAC.31
MTIRNETKTTKTANDGSLFDETSPNNTLEQGEIEQDEKEESSGYCCRMSKRMTMIVLGCMVVFLGLGGAGAGFSQVNDGVYACGSQAPSQRDLDETGLPICLNVEYSNDSSSTYEQARRPLCLAKPPSTSNEPPVYCYEDIKENVVDDISPSYFLWWSPCESCGTAWRMSYDKKDDESYYKLPASRPETTTTLPPLSSSEWLYWTEDDAWESATVTFTECGAGEDSSFVYVCPFSMVSNARPTEAVIISVPEEEISLEEEEMAAVVEAADESPKV